MWIRICFVCGMGWGMLYSLNEFGLLNDLSCIVFIVYFCFGKKGYWELLIYCGKKLQFCVDVVGKCMNGCFVVFVICLLVDVLDFDQIGVLQCCQIVGYC